MRMIALPIAAVIATLLFIRPAHAETPRAYCRSAVTDDALHTIPKSLVPEVTRIFHLGAMPGTQIRRSTFSRCFKGHILVFAVGANLPCGKADTRRDLPGATTWCDEHPGSDFIPMYVTGHDTICRWRCGGTEAVTTGRRFKPDPRGFVPRFWKRLDGSR